MLKKVITLHLLPFLLACTIIIVFLFVTKSSFSEKQVQITKAEAKSHRGRFPNLATAESQINFLGSLQNPSQITLFGSSEFSESPYCSYYFLPDSIGKRAIGIGHEGHQHLPIYTELLFGHQHLKNSEIVIIISPTWFETEGTHPEAFLEYAPQNILASVLNDTAVEKNYKAYIGHYIHQQRKDFVVLSNEMESLMDIYYSKSVNPLLQFNASIRQFMKDKYARRYDITETQFDISHQQKDTERIAYNYENSYKKAQEEFKIASSNNNLHINNAYFNSYVSKSNGDIKRGNLAKIDPTNNTEFEDFKAVTNLLANKGAKASFIILPINTYYYKEPKTYLPLINAVEKEILSHEFPLLNLYESDTAQYEPGTLTDIMHLGDYGWLKVNQFIDSIYHD